MTGTGVACGGWPGPAGPAWLVRPGWPGLAGPARPGRLARAGSSGLAGPEAVEQWLLTPEVPAGSIQATLFAKTVIALMLDDDARLLDIQRSQHMARMRELTRLKQDTDLRTVLLADHALFHVEADLRWIDTTAARLAELRQEVQV